MKFTGLQWVVQFVLLVFLLFAVFIRCWMNYFHSFFTQLIHTLTRIINDYLYFMGFHHSTNYSYLSNSIEIYGSFLFCFFSINFVSFFFFVNERTITFFRVCVRKKKDRFRHTRAHRFPQNFKKFQIIAHKRRNQSKQW